MVSERNCFRSAFCSRSRSIGATSCTFYFICKVVTKVHNGPNVKLIMAKSFFFRFRVMCFNAETTFNEKTHANSELSEVCSLVACRNYEVTILRYGFDDNYDGP